MLKHWEDKKRMRSCYQYSNSLGHSFWWDDFIELLQVESMASGLSGFFVLAEDDIYSLQLWDDEDLFSLFLSATIVEVENEV